MTQRRPTGRRRSWEYPECPECESDVLVEARPSSPYSGDYKCWGCSTHFDKEDE